MKKGFSVIGLIMVVIFVIQMNTSTYLGKTLDDGFVFSNEEKILDMKKLDNQTQVIDLEDFNANKEIYGNNKNISIEKENKSIEASNNFPLFIKGGKTLHFLYDNSNLIDTNLNKTKVSVNQVVTNGSLFDASGNIMDVNSEFILTELNNGLYINLQKMQLTTNDQTYDFGSNSVVFFDTNFITSYNNHNGEFSYTKVSNIDKSAILKIGNFSINYELFLKQAEIVEKNDSEKEIDKNNGINNGSNENGTNLSSNGLNNGANNAGGSNGNGIGGNGNGIGGNGNANGGSSVGSGEGGNNFEGGLLEDKEFITPIVKASDFTANYYSISTDMIIEDPDFHIDKSVFINVKEKDELIIKKPVKKSDHVELLGLKPNVEYDVEVMYDYFNVQKQKTKVVVKEFKIKTKDIKEIKDLTLSYDINSIEERKIVLDNLKSDQIYSNDIISNIDTFYIVLNDSIKYTMNFSDIEALFLGKSVKIDTGNILVSNTDYNISFQLIDKYENEFVITNEPMPYKTAKKIPKINAKNSKIQFDTAEIEYSIINPDNAEIRDLSYELYDINNDLVKKGDINLLNNKFEITNLISRTSYKIVFKSNYNIENGLGVITSEIGNSNLLTASLSSLGNVFVKSTVDSLTSSSANYKFTFDLERTNAVLLSLINGVSLNFKDPSGKVIYTKQYTSSEVESIKKGTIINSSIILLDPNVSYTLEIIPTVKELDKVTDIKVSNNIRVITTYKLAPDHVINSSLFMKNNYSMNFSIKDPYDTIINKKFSVELIDRNTKEVFQTNIYNKLDNINLSYDIYNTTINYGVRIVAFDYNIGRSSVTLEKNKVLFEEPIESRNRLLGDIELNSIEKKDSNSTSRVKISLDDKAGYIKDENFYVQIYKDNVLKETKPYKLIDKKFNQVVSYDLENNSTYKIKLVFYQSNKEMLISEDTFNTNQSIYSISTEAEFFAILPDQKYRVINNITFSNNSQRINADFNGEIDFNGYLMQVPIQSRSYLFNKIGATGKLLNLNYEMTGSLSSNQGSIYLIAENNGKISNVSGKVNVTVPQNWRMDIAGFAYTNKGLIENFSIIAEKSFNAERNASYLVTVNDGIIKNGTVFGVDLSMAHGGSTSNRIAGGVVGNNTATGVVKNVISDIDVIGNDGRLSPNIGNVVGASAGVVENTYSVTTGLVGANNTNGPSIGNTSNSNSKNNYYYSPDGERNNYNKKISSQAFIFDPNFIKSVINKDNKFDVDSPVINGYYPRVKLGTNMSEAPLYALPERLNKDSVDVVTNKVISVNEKRDETVVEVMVDNPNHYKIDSIRVEGMISKIVKQEEENSFSKITLELKASDLFITNYSISNITYNDGTFIKNVSYLRGQRVIEVSLFKTVNSIRDFTLIETNSNFNFDLKTDLNFLNTKLAINNEYVGIIEGNGHTISNIQSDDLSLFKRGMKGAKVTDLTFENISLGYGLVDVTVANSSLFGSVDNTIMDNVFIKNVLLNVSTNAGIFSHNLTNSKLTNIGISESKILVINNNKATLSGTIGGFASTAQNTTFNNVFISGLVIDAKDFNTQTVSGLVSNAQNISISNSYLSDVHINGTNLNLVAGIAYNIFDSASFIMNNSYAYVDINASNGVSNMFGNMRNIVDVKVNNVLTLGNLSTTGNNFNRVALARTNITNFQTNIFSTNIQFINGGNVKNPLINDINIKEFNKASTYRDVIGLGDMFDYSKSSQIKVPLLYNDKKTELLKFQKDVVIQYDSFFVENFKVASYTNNLVTLEYQMSNPNNFEILGFEVENMIREGGVKVVNEELKIYQQTYRPIKYLDQYALTKIDYMNNGPKELNLRSLFNLILYKEIWTIADYNQLSERKGENALIMQDIDFGGQPAENELEINRLSANKKIIRGITTDKPLFKYVNYVDGLIFDRITTINSIFYTVNVSLLNSKFTNIIINTSNTNDGHGIISHTNNGSDKIYKDIVLENNTFNTSGRSYVGELIGLINTSTPTQIVNISSNNAKIVTTNNSGGIIGSILTSLVYLNNIHTNNLTLDGANRVGGIVGETQGMSHIRRSGNLFVTNSKITTTGERNGGIIGLVGSTLSLQNLGVTSTIIKGLDDIGGIFGRKHNNNINLDNIYVIDSDVEGRYRVGGLYGTTYYGGSNINNAMVNARVKATNGPGIIAGYTWNTNHNNIILSGTVNSVDAAATVTGQQGTSSGMYNIINAVSSFTSPSNPQLYSGYNTGPIGQYRLFNNMSLNGLLMKDSPDFGFAQGNTSNLQKFDTINLSSENYYSNLNYTVANWDFSLVGGYQFPKVKDQATNAPLPYQKDVQLPSGTTARTRRSVEDVNNLKDTETVDAITSDIEINPYFSGVDTINLDFNKEIVNENIEIYIGDNLVYDKLTNERTISIKNKLLQEIKVVFVDRDLEIMINPLDYVNKISMFNDNYYYIRDNNLYSKDALVLEGVVNIYENLVLLSDGSIIDLASMGSISSEDGVILDDSVSLETNGNIETYGTYSRVDDVVKEDLLLYKNKNDLDIIKYDSNNDINKVIINNNVQSVLTKSGRISHLKAKFNAPKEFINNGIDDVSTSGDVLSVLYDDSKVVSFNYVTGELLDSNTSNVESSLFSIISEQFNKVFNSSSESMNDYNEFEKVDNYLESNSSSLSFDDKKYENTYNLQNKFQIAFNSDTKEYDIYDVNTLLDPNVLDVVPMNVKVPEFTDQVLAKVSDPNKSKGDGFYLIGALISVILLSLYFHKRNTDK